MVSKKIHFFQHVPFEGLSMIESWIKKNNHNLSSTQFFNQNFKIPTTNDYDALIILGGPMGVYDVEDYPWLNLEKEHINKAINENKPILGICLGAQLIANVLGANISQNAHQEIGWFPINLINNQHSITKGLNQTIDAFHWHRDTFDIPSGAVHLAKSEACKNQAFIYKDKVLGLQFHLEMDEQAIKEVIKNCGAQLKSNKYIQDKEKILSSIPDNKNILYTLLDNWLANS